MEFTGTYKAAKVIKNIDGEGFVFVDIEKALLEASEDERRSVEETARMVLIVDDDANIHQGIAIPEGTPAQEIEKAKSAGMKVSDDGKYMLMKTDAGKIQDGALYLHDASTFLAGTEWVKISTDVPDELNIVTTIFKKI